ncbi:hypothetical protein FOMPIDRAFT_1020958 [Fomitopsis schrenkii]|uniref:Uncharacterized protein n=1 Tax=Fomitopsis schrenkii TaxID=2126942 RepID=S8DMK4_FOMSC|nr:hypothetical protein FOMPIDRAFT_1020977 [Fomitopsis schrenkii]EPS92613.1 hypothetical protein FOMPIDRAFT_1020958 [Fomitopsis schrenkii]
MNEEGWKSRTSLSYGPKETAPLVSHSRVTRLDLGALTCMSASRHVRRIWSRSVQNRYEHACKIVGRWTLLNTGGLSVSRGSLMEGIDAQARPLGLRAARRREHLRDGGCERLAWGRSADTLMGRREPHSHHRMLGMYGVREVEIEARNRVRDGLHIGIENGIRDRVESGIEMRFVLNRIHKWMYKCTENTVE